MQLLRDVISSVKVSRVRVSINIYVLLCAMFRSCVEKSLTKERKELICSMIIDNKLVSCLAEETGVRKVIARIALEHAKGSISVARDLLGNEVYQSRLEREAREYGRDED